MLMIWQAPIGNRVARDAHGVDRFVEADRRRDRALQLHVIDHVVVVERLLDHHQIVGVEPREMRARRSSV